MFVCKQKGLGTRLIQCTQIRIEILVSSLYTYMLQHLLLIMVN